MCWYKTLCIYGDRLGSEIDFIGEFYCHNADLIASSQSINSPSTLQFFKVADVELQTWSMNKVL